MDHKKIIVQLKEAKFKTIEASSIKRKLRELPSSERIKILNRLEEEKSKSDNADIIDVINDIVSDLKPPK